MKRHFEALERCMWPDLILICDPVHSVSKETHHEFIGFPCDPGQKVKWPQKDHIWSQEFETGHIVTKSMA